MIDILVSILFFLMSLIFLFVFLFFSKYALSFQVLVSAILSPSQLRKTKQSKNPMAVLKI